MYDVVLTTVTTLNTCVKHLLLRVALRDNAYTLCWRIARLISASIILL